MNVDVRVMAESDIDHVVALQSAFLEGSLVTEFGPGFLRRFHAGALSHAATRGFVAVDGGAIAGFVLASLDVHGFNAHVKPRVLLPLAAALVDPRRWHLAASLLRAPFEPDPQPHIPGELLLLVVDARGRRRGIGRRLLSVLEGAFAKEGVSRYRVAVRSRLTVARAFYEALGFEHEQDLTVLGQPMTYLTKRVDAR